MILTIGSLCSGYGGLDLAVESFFGARTSWFSEFDPAPSKILARHWPGVPNLGDMTVIDWATVEPVDIIAGGTPCQDLSGAGKRAGMTEGTRSNLWVQMREAVAVIRPKYVVWENVRGAYSAYAVSEVESETGLLGGYGPDRPALRALGRVLGDLSDLGYDTQWVGVRAADVGAPHGRFRVFVLAHDSDTERLGWVEGCKEPGSSAQFADYVGGLGASGVGGETGDSCCATTDTSRLRRDEGWQSTPRQTACGGTPTVNGGCCGTPTADTNSAGRIEHGRTVTVQPEHAPTEHRSAVIADTGSERFGQHPRGSFTEETGQGSSDLTNGADRPQPVTDWGPYRPAIQRWEQVLDRTAPAPTEPTGKGGAHRLSPKFVEFMMGAEPGWVTDPAIGLTRNQQLKALGNGVVTLQAEYALSILFPQSREVAA